MTDDTLRCYGDIAAAWRRERALPVVAITGSNGKTSLANLSRQAFPAAVQFIRHRVTLNNLIGTPKTLLDWRGSEAGVIEVGMSEPGELAAWVR